MQDLFQNYVGDLIKVRDSFHDELTATAGELSKAMDIYAERSEAALASFMEKVATSAIPSFFRHERIAILGGQSD